MNRTMGLVKCMMRKIIESPIKSMPNKPPTSKTRRSLSDNDDMKGMSTSKRMHKKYIIKPTMNGDEKWGRHAFTKWYCDSTLSICHLLSFFVSVIISILFINYWHLLCNCM